MQKIIAVANQKGGVGKTTTVVNLSACLAEMGYNILLADLDPQGNATSGCGINKRGVSLSSYDVLVGEIDIQEAIIKTEFKNLSILPSTMDLAGAEVALVDIKNRAQRLRDSFLKLSYDYILIDCPPSLGLLTINALTSADTVLIPIQCEFYALEGLSQLTNTIKQVKRLYNPRLEIEGILITMFDARVNLTQQVLAEVKKFFADKIFTAVIPRNIRISEAPSHGMPINYYDKSCKGSVAYSDMAIEFIKRNKDGKSSS